MNSTELVVPNILEDKDDHFVELDELILYENGIDSLIFEILTFFSECSKSCVHILSNEMLPACQFSKLDVQILAC